MRISFLLISLFTAAFLLSSCQKEPEIIVIPDNSVLPDETVAEVIKQNYVTKLYIGLLGRKPSDAELSQAMADLSLDNASVTAREQLLDEVMAQPEFSYRMFDVAKTEMLNNVDTAEISFQIYIFSELLKDPAYQDFISLIEAEMDQVASLARDS